MSETKYDRGIRPIMKDGKLHCVDGPAVEYHNGNKEWWINGKYFYSCNK